MLRSASVRLRTLSLIARKLANVQGATIAAPQYLAKRGTPRVPEDLRKHEAILDLNMADPYTWIFRAGSKRLDVRVSSRTPILAILISVWRRHALASASHASQILS